VEDAWTPKQQQVEVMWSRGAKKEKGKSQVDAAEGHSGGCLGPEAAPSEDDVGRGNKRRKKERAARLDDVVPAEQEKAEGKSQVAASCSSMKEAGPRSAKKRRKESS